MPARAESRHLRLFPTLAKVLWLTDDGAPQAVILHPCGCLQEQGIAGRLIGAKCGLGELGGMRIGLVCQVLEMPVVEGRIALCVGPARIQREASDRLGVRTPE